MLKVREEVDAYHMHNMRDSDGKPLKIMLLNGQKYKIELTLIYRFEEKKTKDLLIYLRGLKAYFKEEEKKVMNYTLPQVENTKLRLANKNVKKLAMDSEYIQQFPKNMIVTFISSKQL
jgi:hypothetical protein